MNTKTHIINIMKRTKHTLVMASLLAVFALSCGEKAPPSAPSPPAVSLPQSLITGEAPPNALGVVDARKDVSPGAKIVVTGFIGGRRKPFVEGRAVFTLADNKALTRCDLKPNDPCKTPWDACCDTQETLKASVATIQAVDGAGLVLKQTLKGFGGIQPGSYVIVQGKIAPGATGAALIINAEKIHLTTAP